MIYPKPYTLWLKCEERQNHNKLVNKIEEKRHANYRISSTSLFKGRSLIKKELEKSTDETLFSVLKLRISEDFVYKFKR